MPTPNDSIQDLKNKRDIWIRQHSSWNKIHYIAGIIGLLCTALAAAKEQLGTAAGWFGLPAAICLAVMTFLNPQKKSSAYLRAYKIMDGGLLRYNEGLIDKPALFESYDKAEAVANGDD